MTRVLPSTLPACAYIRDDVPAVAPRPRSAKAEIDGDLIESDFVILVA